ncbi:hypothetical protein R5R35_001809 [Gryllus longicercus]|uniref:Deltamethrin resistance protein prag01 domain-containing protein n=1 Tax=Gryllus longicercus TaxID=2509291 RepID=A0AAN9W4H1_9ORTH
MLTRVILPSARRLVQANVGATSRVCAYHAPAHPETTVGDLPIPQGSWQADYESKQRKYNLHLLMGIGFTVGTLIVAKASGLFHLNYSVPQLKDQ